jgi:hypothetical protein
MFTMSYSFTAAFVGEGGGGGWGFTMLSFDFCILFCSFYPVLGQRRLFFS